MAGGVSAWLQPHWHSRPMHKHAAPPTAVQAPRQTELRVNYLDNHKPSLRLQVTASFLRTQEAGFITHVYCNLLTLALSLSLSLPPSLNACWVFTGIQLDQNSNEPLVLQGCFGTDSQAA